MFKVSDAPAPNKYNWKTSTISDIKFSIRQKVPLEGNYIYFINLLISLIIAQKFLKNVE